jgi:hypothetical protein
MLARKLLALFKYITKKKKIAYLMGIVHTEKLRISFLEPLLVYILFNFSKSISDLTFILEVFWHLYLRLEGPTIIRRLQILYSCTECCQLIIY